MQKSTKYYVNNYLRACEVTKQASLNQCKLGTLSQKSSIKRQPPSSRLVITIIFYLSHMGATDLPQFSTCCVLGCICKCLNAPLTQGHHFVQHGVIASSPGFKRAEICLTARGYYLILSSMQSFYFQILCIPPMWHQCCLPNPVTVMCLPLPIFSNIMEKNRSITIGNDLHH